MTGAMDIAIMAVRFVQFCAAMFLLGAPVFVLATVLCHAGAGDIRADFLPWFRRWSLVAALTALASALAWLDIETAIWGGGWDNAIDPGTVSTALFDTEFGRAWQWHLGLEAALVVLLLVPMRGTRWLALLALLGAAHVAGLAWAGHGMMGMSPLQLPVQVIHVLAGGLWLGSLPALFHLLRAARSRPSAEAAARKMLPLYSRAGYGVVAVLVLSGVGNSFFLIDSVNELVTTVYDGVLLLKLVLVAAMIGVALGNRISLVPLVVAGDGAAPIALLVRRVAAEQGLALLVLAVVSVLGMLPPR
jgi:putative copper resistance protein D